MIGKTCKKCGKPITGVKRISKYCNDCRTPQNKNPPSKRGRPSKSFPEYILDRGIRYPTKSHHEGRHIFKPVFIYYLSEHKTVVVEYECPCGQKSFELAEPGIPATEAHNGS